MDNRDVATILKDGIQLHTNKDFEGAIVKYNQAIELNPTLAAAFHNRGNAHLALRKPELALQDYNQAIELNPTLAAAFHNRGNAHLALRKLELAIQDYNQAIARNPKDAMAFFSRGLAFLTHNKIERAICDFESAISLRHGYSDAFFNRGLAFLKHNQIDAAISDFHEVARLEPMSGRACLGLGRAFCRARRLKQSRDHLENALQYLTEEIDVRLAVSALGDTALPRLWRGQTLRDLALLEPVPTFITPGRRKNYLEKSLSDFSEALALDPLLVEATVERGYTHLAFGEVERARQDLVSARHSNPQRTAPLRRLFCESNIVTTLLAITQSPPRYFKSYVRYNLYCLTPLALPHQTFLLRLHQRLSWNLSR